MWLRMYYRIPSTARKYSTTKNALCQLSWLSTRNMLLSHKFQMRDILLLLSFLLHCFFAFFFLISLTVSERISVFVMKGFVTNLWGSSTFFLFSQGKYERLVVDMRNEIEREREKSSSERHSLASQLEQAMRESKDLSALLRERDEVNS